MSIKSDLSNSTITVDFNKEITGVLSDTTRVNGRELKLAVAIYLAPEQFRIADLLNPNTVGKVKKAERQRTALAAHSEAFKSQIADAKRLTDIAKNKNVSTDKRMKAEIDVAPVKTAIAAAMTMFDRALVSAYYMQLSGSIVKDVKDKFVDLEYRVPFIRGTGDKATEISGREKLSRADCHAFGKAMAIARGVAKAPTVAATQSVSTGTQKTVLEGAKVFADTVSKLDAKAKADITTSAEFEEMIVTSIRARCSHDGTLNMSDVFELLRKHDAMQGVNVINDLAPAPRKRNAQAA